MVVWEAGGCISRTLCVSMLSGEGGCIGRLAVYLRGVLVWAQQAKQRCA